MGYLNIGYTSSMIQGGTRYPGYQEVPVDRAGFYMAVQDPGYGPTLLYGPCKYRSMDPRYRSSDPVYRTLDPVYRAIRLYLTYI